MIGAGADENTVTTFTPSTLCVQPGDRIALSPLGGGTQFQAFARGVPGASTFSYAASGTEGIGNGATITPGPAADGVELLLQVVVGSQSQARAACGGSAARPDPGAGPDTPDPAAPGTGTGTGGGGSGSGQTPLRPKTTASLKAVRVGKDGRVPLSLSCRAGGTTCKGKVTLRAHRRTIGTARFSIAAGARKTVKVKLGKRGRGYVRKERTLRTAVLLKTTGGISKGGIVKVKRRA